LKLARRGPRSSESARISARFRALPDALLSLLSLSRHIVCPAQSMSHANLPHVAPLYVGACTSVYLAPGSFAGHKHPIHPKWTNRRSNSLSSNSCSHDVASLSVVPSISCRFFPENVDRRCFFRQSSYHTIVDEISLPLDEPSTPDGSEPLEPRIPSTRSRILSEEILHAGWRAPAVSPQCFTLVENWGCCARWPTVVVRLVLSP